MRNLLLNFHAWREDLRNRPLAVMLDYDGTLAEIAPSPAEARLPFVTRELLRRLASLRDVKIAVVSGRSVRALRRMIAVKGITYVGSHGMEMQLRGSGNFKVPARYVQELRRWKERLTGELRDLPGVMLEQKPFSLAIHYRKASLSSERNVKKIILEVCYDAVFDGKLEIRTGKKVIELMPPAAMDKGQAVGKLLRIWGRNRYLPVFVGDDLTDEDAFEVLRGKGLTVRVGKPGSLSRAEYFVNDVAEVRSLLRMILNFRGSPLHPERSTMAGDG